MQIFTLIQFLVLSLCVILVVAKDYYEILGVKRDASEKEIKRKFRQLGKKKIFIFEKLKEKKQFFF